MLDHVDHKLLEVSLADRVVVLALKAKDFADVFGFVTSHCRVCIFESLLDGQIFAKAIIQESCTDLSLWDNGLHRAPTVKNQLFVVLEIRGRELALPLSSLLTVRRLLVG